MVFPSVWGRIGPPPDFQRDHITPELMSGCRRGGIFSEYPLTQMIDLDMSTVLFSSLPDLLGLVGHQANVYIN